MDVLLFEHRGIPCAVPHGQVDLAVAEPGERLLDLWLGATEAAGDETWIRIGGDRAAGHVGCRRLAVAVLDSPHPLPALLREALGLPHVVGWTVIDQDIVWLVDLERLEASR